MTGLDRRDFVKIGATGAFFLGLPLARGEFHPGNAGPGAPANWAQFRAEMKKRNQPGVIVLLTFGQANATKDEDAKRKQLAAVPHPASQPDPLATAIHASLFSCGDSELPLLLSQAVFIAAPADQVRKEFPSIPAGAAMALVNGDGKVLNTLPAEVDLGKKFTDRAAELLFGKDGARLEELVKAERTALGEATCKQFDAAVIDLDDDAFPRRQAASEALGKLFPKVPASLTRARRAASSLEVRSRIDSLFRKPLHADNVGALFQQSLASYTPSSPHFNVRIKCGQGALLPHAHEFVQRWCQPQA